MLNSGFNTSSTFPQPESAIAQMPVLGLPSIESRREERESSLGNPKRHAAVLDLMTRLLRVNQISIVRNNVAKLIAEHLHASFVAVGANSLQTTPSPLAVIAGTETPEVDIRDDIEAALGESVVTARIHYLSNVRGEIAVRQASQAGFAHQRLARLLNPASSICSVPLLTDDGRCAGALLVAWSNCGESQGKSRGHFDFLQAASTPLAELLLNLEGNTPSKLAASWKTVRDQLTRQRKICLLAVSAALIAIGFVPVRYPVLTNVSIQPTVRRWVVAPFDAPLNKAYVTPGQSVKTGELLFTLDCEETLHKLASLRADAERSSSERSAHLSAGRLSDAAIAGWNAKGTNSEIEILTKHLDRAEIRSPIDGVVLGEDLQRLEGSPLVSGNAQWYLPTSMIGWLFDWRSVVAVIVSWVIALSIVILDHERFANDVATILEPSGWIRFACVWLVLKIVHELGHLVCCRRFGGRVGEAGIAWMLVAPVAYVDLTDLYRMKSRSRRVFICLAGIYVEMIVAGVSVFFWSQSLSPWCNHLFATVAITASVGSLLFNLNPLMKLDGYHALCDWIGRPHLASDGARAMNGFASRVFLGKINNRNRASFRLTAYGIAAFAYRIAITIGLVAGSYVMYGRVGFVVVGLLSLLISFPVAIRNTSRILIELRARPASAIRLLFVSSCLLGIAGTAWKLRDRWQSGWCGIVEYSDDSPVRCVSSGKAVRVLIEPGQQVEEGDVIVELENLSIVAQRAKAESELAAGQARWKRLRELHSTAGAAAELEANRAIEVRLQSLVWQEQDLLVRAPRSGIVIAMEPSRWLGQWLEAGEPLAYVVDDTKKKAIVAVPQDAIENVAAMQGERVIFCDTDGGRIEGIVSSITCQAELTPPHPAMAASAGGQLAVRPDNEPSNVILLSPHLRLEAMIDDTFKRLRPGQSLTLVR